MDNPATRPEGEHARASRPGPVRIGCAAGFWGDSDSGAQQLVQQGGLDYLVFDYLAEITMSLLARARQKNPDMGYAPDFVGLVARLAPQILERKIKVVANAGGVNPLACRAALLRALAADGLSARVAVVLGDDLSDRLQRPPELDTRDMDTGKPLPTAPSSINAYLGARPIAAALALGADIVITGRCVDSALVLGPLMHEFGWREDQYDLLSAGTLAGHLIECGCQVTGGVFSDWEQMQGWDNPGFPIAECHPDGSVIITKPDGTGGTVSPASVGEQLVYEIGDPAAYLMPDVTCDWTAARLAAEGPDRVCVSGARGRPPAPRYKVCATYPDGFRATTSLTIAGGDAGLKARRVAAGILDKCRRMLRERGIPDYAETSIEVIGEESMYGAHARPIRPREVMLKLAVCHADRRAVELFSREIAPAVTATAPGITGFFAGRPNIVPVIRLHSFLLDQSAVSVTIDLDEHRHELDPPRRASSGNAQAGISAQPPNPAARPPACLSGPRSVQVPVGRLARARSGDKGDHSNIGVLARRPEYVPILRKYLTEQVVLEYFSHFAKGRVARYELPGIDAFNFVLSQALGGGGVASLRIDPQGKCFAPILLDMELEISRDDAVEAGLADTPAP